MKRTVNRTPQQISQVSSDGRIDNFNIISFEGITNSENDLTVSPSTFLDANNMYINSNNVLSSRPTIKSCTYLNTNHMQMNDIKQVWVVNNILIYHVGTKLKFVKDNIPVENVEIEVGDIVKVLESIEGYILVYPKNIYINILSYETGNISDICYIPTTELRSGSEIDHPEKANILSPYSKHSIIYDKSVYTDLSDLYGKNVDILIGDRTYHIDNYKEHDIETLQGLLTIADFDYVKYSNVGSAIGVKDGVVYYSSNGKSFIPLPDVPGVTIQQVNSQGVSYPKFIGEVFISEEGDCAFMVGTDHIYAISLLETDWDSITNTVKKRWSTWTSLDWNSQYSKLTWDESSKITEQSAQLSTDFDTRLNIINVTRPNSPRPNYYSKNYARILNENTFVIYMYAGDLDESLVGGNPSNYVKPTIFVYNRQSIDSKVKIYQITNAKTELTHNDNYGIGEYAGGDFSLFGNIMILSCAFRYANNNVAYSELSTFVLKVDNNNYTFRSGKKILISDALSEFVGDLKINYSSSSTSDLNAEINFVYTDNVNSSKIILRKYTMIENSQTNDQIVTYVLNISAVGDIVFNDMFSPFIIMSRSSLRIAVSTGLITTTGDLVDYEFINYRTSNLMKPIYIDEDSLITLEGSYFEANVKNEGSTLIPVFTQDQQIIISTYHHRLNGLVYKLVTNDNKNNMNINPGVTSCFIKNNNNEYELLNTPPNTLDEYVDKYIVNIIYSYYTHNYYTTDNIIATFSTIVEKENFNIPDIQVSTKLTDIYFGSDRNLYIGKILYDKDENVKLYFSEGLWEEFEESIFQLQILSKNSVGIYCRDSIWIIYSDDKGIYYKAKSKISSSCRDGDDVVFSIDGKGSLYPCHRGIAYIEHQSLLSVEEQKLSFITDDIKNYMIEWLKGKSVKMFNHEFWLYVYSSIDKVIWVMDLRYNQWWKWTLPYPIENIFIYMDKLYVLMNNKICQFTETGDYYDIFELQDHSWDKKVIPWSLESQRLYLEDINRYKHIYNIVINSRVEDEEVTDISMRLSMIIYRSMISKTPDSVLEYKVSGRRSYVKKVSIFKCNFIKFKLSSDTSDTIESSNVKQRQMKIEGITIKYGLRERIR